MQLNNEYLVSVIIPIYNVEKYLKICLDSVVNQTYSNMEIILVDDGSTDSCSQICDDYARIDDRIVVIHKKNGGLSDARNSGIEIAKGYYVTFIDSDDCVNLTYVEKLVLALADSEADISICTRRKVDETFTEYDKPEQCLSEVNYFNNISCIRESYFSRYSGINATAWAKMYRTSLFCENDITYPVGEINEDMYTTYKLYYYANKIAYIDVELYYYRQRSGSIMYETKNKFGVQNMRVTRATEEAIIFYLQKNEKELASLAINFHIRLLFGLNYRLETCSGTSYEEKEKYRLEMQKSVFEYLKYGYLCWQKQLLYALVARVPVRFLLKKIGV